MWYKKPAVNWNEALPIGNGRMGAMVHGRVKAEIIQLNEQTLWSGGPRNWNNPDAKKYLPLVRKAALEGNYRKADSLSKFMQGPYTESYMPMADVVIRYPYLSDSASYTRELDLDNAITTVKFKNKGEVHTRQAFASFPDKVVVMRHTSSKKGTISFKVGLTSKLHFKVYVLSSNHLVLKGKCPRHVEPAYLWRIKNEQAVQYAENEEGEGMTFEVHLMVKNESGKISADGQGIMVEGADAATFIFSAATSYNGFDKSPGLSGKDSSLEALPILEDAWTKTFDALKQRHIEDHQSFFRRFNLFLGESKYKNLPTDERLKNMSTYTDPELVASIVQFGRYLLIAGSRPGGQPLNLKGIWNERLRPEYSSNWCIDHDAQMFYYPVETTNLSEMHEPFLQFIEDLATNGKVTASVNYGMRGWCAHHNADVWRSSGPVGNWGEGNPHWATWNMSGPWLSAHLFDHYLFTGDETFLKEKAWPVMKGAAAFCLDWLTQDQNGNLISVPSVSPENTFITEKGDTAQISVNTTGDLSLMKQLFSNCVTTTEILKIDTAFSTMLKTSLKMLLPYTIGSKGQLLEWSQDWKAVDPSHRHLTHLYPVFPGDEITPYRTPDLSNAAKRALTLREKTNCSWGFAWKAACWARLGEADSSWSTWKYQLHYVDPKSRSSYQNYGLYPNFFNSDGADVIMNGNGCATAVMSEMLLQSHGGEISLLPALPKAFGHGKVKGICARGGFVVDLSWNRNTLTEATIYSRLGKDCIIRVNSSIEVFDGSKSITVLQLDKNANVYSFKTEKGKKYRIRPL